MFFIYNLLFNSTITNGSSDVKNINIGGQDFDLYEIRTTEQSKVRVTLKTAEGNLFSSTAFDSALIGKGMNGYRLPKPLRLTANTQLVVQITNNSGASIDNFEIMFIGEKLETA
ncbi:MAG: hypothetical protein QXF76_04025 [Candidatus Anstonellales archaeon]